MIQFSEILSKQISVGETLMQRVSSLPEGTKSSIASGLVIYDKSLTQPLADDADAWETETLVYLRSLYGDESTPVKEFEKNTQKKNRYSDLKKGLYSDLNKNIALLKALIQADLMKMEMTKQMKIDENKTSMIFISHSSEDKDFVEALVDLLESMGLDTNTVFCSSVDGYGIGLGKDIFETLLRLFRERDLFVIFIQSPRYYNSPVSLNEMGAAWVLKTDCCSMLTSDMERTMMKGVVNDSTIYIKVNNEDASSRLNELKERLTELFNLTPLSQTTWDRKRKSFLDRVTSIHYTAKTTPEDPEVSIKLSLEELDVLRHWVESDYPYSTQQSFMGNRIVYYLGKRGYEATKAEDKAEWEDFFERLIKLNYITLHNVDKSGRPQYKLKKAAYDYIKNLK